MLLFWKICMSFPPHFDRSFVCLMYDRHGACLSYFTFKVLHPTHTHILLCMLTLRCYPTLLAVALLIFLWEVCTYPLKLGCIQDGFNWTCIELGEEEKLHPSWSDSGALNQALEMKIKQNLTIGMISSVLEFFHTWPKFLSSRSPSNRQSSIVMGCQQESKSKPLGHCNQLQTQDSNWASMTFYVPTISKNLISIVDFEDVT